MDTYKVYSNKSGKFDVVDTAGKYTIRDISTRVEALRLIADLQNKQIVEDIFRRRVQLEFTRITEDFKMDRIVALEIMREEINKLAQPLLKKTPLRILQEDEDHQGCGCS